MNAPYRPSTSEPAAVEVQRRDNGEILLSCPYQIGEIPQDMVQLLLERAEQFPERVLIAEQNLQGEWVHLTYADAVRQCRSVAQWLISKGASIEKPLVILSNSSINHFLMAWGALFARVPYTPVSMSYSTVKGAYPKLEAVLDVVKPGFVFAEALSVHSDALQNIQFDTAQVELIAVQDDGAATVNFSDLLATHATDAVDDSIQKINHDTITRYMFTSGSTGMPKGVIHTHGMSCYLLASSNGLQGDKDLELGTRVLDWMPWSHVGAGVMRVAMIIDAAGSIYLDTGKPVPGEFDKTIANLKTVKPTQYVGAPLGWAMLADALEKDDAFAATFYQDLRVTASGSAAMPASLAKRLDDLAVKYTGMRYPSGTSLLSTEVSCGLSRYWTCEDTSVIGLPTPSVTVKLVPFGQKYEIRILSPGTTPGYLNEPEKTRKAFDEEGFFKMGDAVSFFDAQDAAKGLVFAGRVAEEFKLQTGTWVSAGTLRAEVVTAASPYVRDAVICGLNETYVSVLMWPNIESCGALAESNDPNVIVEHAKVLQAVSHGIAEHNAKNPNSSKRIARFLMMSAPPDAGAYEITDKGYVNQGEVIVRRASEVARLYQTQPDSGVVVLSEA